MIPTKLQHIRRLHFFKIQFLSIILLALFGFLFIQANTLHAMTRDELVEVTQDPGDYTLDRFQVVTKEAGIINALRLMFTEKGARGVMYHSFAGVPNNCAAPNAWYIPEGQEVYCPAPGSDPRNGELFVCGKTCPEERQTGLACGMGHHCCLPENAPSTQTPKGGCETDVITGIKFCTF